MKKKKKNNPEIRHLLTNHPATIMDRLTGHTHACSAYNFSLQMDSMITVCLFVYLGRNVGGHMLVHEQLMDRSRLIQKYKSG